MLYKNLNLNYLLYLKPELTTKTTLHHTRMEHLRKPKNLRRRSHQNNTLIFCVTIRYVSVIPSFLLIYLFLQLLSPTYSLATVKAFFWKSGDDITFHYRINAKYADSDKHKAGKKGAKKLGTKKLTGLIPHRNKGNP